MQGSKIMFEFFMRFFCCCLQKVDILESINPIGTLQRMDSFASEASHESNFLGGNNCE